MYIASRKEHCPDSTELKRDNRQTTKHVNLFYVQDPWDDNVGHFAWIKNLSQLVSSQLSKKEHRKYICDRYNLHYFESDNKLQSHTVVCREMNECAIRLPNENDKWLSFDNYNRKERLLFIVYADLDVGYYMQCSYDETLSAYRSYRGVDCITWFDEFEKLAHSVKNIIFTNVLMVTLSQEQWDISQRDALSHL
ncbi:hypothetical protein ACFW04_013907 [Cataglyphis niger]